LVPEKGLRLLIQALAGMETEWRLVIAGEGEEREPCRMLAEQLEVADRISFLGWISSSAMAANLQACACVAVPSLWPEPFGRLGPEAFLHGRPVVAFAVGGVPDWLEDGRTGFLVAPGDTAGLAHALYSLLESPASCLRMGQHARQRALAAWKADAHAKRLLSVFDHARSSR
jgi:glycosyltransferase involved in cell wall biosynthesis